MSELCQDTPAVVAPRGRQTTVRHALFAGGAFAATLEVVREIFKGFVMLRLLAFIPLSIVIVVLLGISALTRGSAAIGIAILAAVPVVLVAAIGWLMARRAGKGRR